MVISGITPPQVWAASSRSLTNFGSSALAATNNANASIAGAASVDLRSSAGVVSYMSVACKTGVGATAAISINEWDGTNSFQVAATSAAAGVTAGWFNISNNTVGVQLFNNDATHAGNYHTAAISMTI